MDEQALRQALSRKHSDDLLAIAVGREEGYLPIAEMVAEEILRERGITLSEEERRLKQALTSAKAEYESKREGVERDAAARHSRRWGLLFLTVGILSFFLPLSGSQFRFLIPLGSYTYVVSVLAVIAGWAILSHAERTAAALAVGEREGFDLTSGTDPERRRPWFGLFG